MIKVGIYGIKILLPLDFIIRSEGNYEKIHCIFFNNVSVFAKWM